MATEQKKNDDPLIETTSNKVLTLSRFPELSLLELSSYLSWDCPLNDTSLVALIARLILEYAGNNPTISILQRSSSSYAQLSFDCGCVSNDGMFYGIHNEEHRQYYYYSGTIHILHMIVVNYITNFIL